MKKFPLVTVGMPVYNGEPYVVKAIQGILDQSFEDFELIISDNASTDNTEQICLGFSDQDSRIRYYRNSTNIGAAENYNRLVRLANGKYFRWSNADDMIGRRLQELCLQALETHPDAVLTYGRTELIDEHGQKIRAYADNLHITDDLASRRLSRYFDQVGLTNAIYGLMRTDAVLKTGLFGNGSLVAADVAFMAELILLGTFVEIPETLFYRRIHSAASSSDRSNEELQQAFWSAARSKHSLPILRQTGRLLRRIWRIRLPMMEKLRLNIFLFRRLIWQRSKVASELLKAIKA